MGSHNFAYPCTDISVATFSFIPDSRYLAQSVGYEAEKYKVKQPN